MPGCRDPVLRPECGVEDGGAVSHRPVPPGLPRPGVRERPQSNDQGRGCYLGIAKRPLPARSLHIRAASTARALLEEETSRLGLRGRRAPKSDDIYAARMTADKPQVIPPWLSQVLGLRRAGPGRAVRQCRIRGHVVRWPTKVRDY